MDLPHQVIEKTRNSAQIFSHLGKTHPCYFMLICYFLKKGKTFVCRLMLLVCLHDFALNTYKLLISVTGALIAY